MLQQNHLMQKKTLELLSEGVRDITFFYLELQKSMPDFYIGHVCPQLLKLDLFIIYK
jgi:hypothetical protein